MPAISDSASPPALPAPELTPELLALPMAASVVILRPAASGGPAAPEVLMIRRSPHAPFMSGFWAFPGGRHDAADGERGDASLSTARRTGVRETREEVGLSLAPEVLAPLGAWRTPAYLVTPILTHFFAAAVDRDAGETAAVDGVELVELAWRPAADVLADWDAGRLLLAPPTRFLLRTLADLGPAARTLSALSAAALAGPNSAGIPPRSAPIRPDIELFGLRSPTLPPATHTNCYIIGRERLVVVDPAGPEASEQAELFAYLDARQAAGARVEAVVLTHAHRDHIAAAPAVSARYGVPILCHADAVATLPFPAEGVLRDLAPLPAGDTPLQVLHTPGHAPGHVVLWHAETRTAICGDLVAGVGTILVDPDEGSMAQYLAALARVRGLGPAALLPAHGGAMGGAVEKLDEYIHHREWREARVLDALTPEPASLEALVTRVYDDVPPHVLPIALLSLRAHLAKLRDEGRAHTPSPGAWAAAPARA